jgi:DNA primase
MNVDFRAIDVRTFLHELGIGEISETHNAKTGLEIRFSCPFPAHVNGDRNPSARMNAESTAYRCWSCGAKGNAVSFLAELEGVSPLVAARWIRQRFQGGFRDVAEGQLWASLRQVMDDQKPTGIRLVEAIAEDEQDERAVAWNAVADVYGSGAEMPSEFSYMLDRGFDWSTLEEWEVGYDHRSGRITIPVRDHDARLLGFKARAVDGRDPKYLVLGGIGYNFEPYETSRVVFGMHRAKLHCAETLYLIEGELNVIASQMKGFKNSAGISGRFLSDEQASIVRNFTDRVVLVFDDPTDAWAIAETLEPYLAVAMVESHDVDPADLKTSELAELYASARSTVELSLT